MSAIDSAVKKVKTSQGNDLDHVLQNFSATNLFRIRIVYGVSGNATGEVEYVGFAPANASLSDPFWLIKKLVYDSTPNPTDVLLASGESLFNKVMSSYSSYTYSAS